MENLSHNNRKTDISSKHVIAPVPAKSDGKGLLKSSNTANNGNGTELKMVRSNDSIEIKQPMSSWIRNKLASTISPELFRAFVNGRLPGFRIPEFISAKDANLIADRINQHVQEYKTAPGVGRAGESLVEHPYNFDEYAEFAAVWKDKNISIPDREHLVNECCGFLTRNTGFPYTPLKYGQSECFYGLFRKINSGAGWHVDNVSKDSSSFKDRKVKFQGSIILHLKVPLKGGGTVIANRRAMKGDSEYLNEDGWTYQESMLDETNKANVPCCAGDLVLLSTLDYHMVSPSASEKDDRISFSMFLVIFEDEPRTIYFYN